MAMVSGPRVFFDVIGTYNATTMIKDSRAQMAVVESIMLDAVDGIRQSFAGLGEMISSITDEVVPLAMSLSEATIEFEKFAGQNKALAAEIIETGAGFGFTAEQALSAGSRMAQLSALVGEAATATATELGQQFALISGMGTEEAMQRMINLQQQTGFMYGDLTNKQFRLLSAENQRATVMSNTLETLDQLNTVENRSAATLKQITFVMNQFAAQAHQTGESIANMAAMSATLIEAGEEQGKAGRALRMIYARLGSNVQGNNDLLKQYGVTTHDTTTGALLPMSNIVGQLAKIFPQLTAAERQNIVQVVAGNDHYVRFVKLIQNFERSTELATDALENQATAQEEVSRVTEDASTKYKEAQAELQHVKAQLGQQLLPTMTEFVQFQTRMNQAFLELSNIPFFGRMGVFIVQMQQYGQVFGRVMDLMLNMKSVSIAMRTYETIIRAVNKEEIVRTDNYRNQGTLTRATLQNQEQLTLSIIATKQARAELAIAEDLNNAKIQDGIQKRQLIEQGEQRIKQLVAEKNLLYDQEQQKLVQIAGLRLSAVEHAERQRHAIKGQVLMENQLTTMQRTRLTEFIEKGDEKLLKLHQEYTLKERIFATDRRYTDIEGNEAELKLIDKKIKKLEALMNTRRRMLAEDDLAIILKEKHIDIDARQSMINDEIIMEMQLLGFEKQELTLLTIAEIEALNNLAIAKDNLSNAERKATIEKQIAAVQERKAILGMKESTAEVHRFNAATNAMSLGLGVLSGAFMMFGHHLPFVSDEQEAMRISMVLMTMSMIPAAIQMGAMTLSMMGVKSAADLATFSIMGLNTVMSYTLVLTGGILLVGLAMWMADVAMESQMAAVEVEGMNTALAHTRELLQDMSLMEAQALAVPQALQRFGHAATDTFDITTASIEDLARMMDATAMTMAELKEDQAAFAEDDPMFAMLQRDINALDEFNSLLGQGMIARFGKELEGLTDQQKILKILSTPEMTDQMAEYYAPPDASFGGKGFDLARYKEQTGTTMVETTGTNVPLDDVPGGHAQRQAEYKEVPVYTERVIESVDELVEAMADGTVKFGDLTDRGKEFFLAFADTAAYANNTFYQGTDEMGEAIVGIGDNFTEAEEKMRAFANAREELFFGGKSSYMSGDMMKQVVNKGVENLYSNVELVMTNNFNGITIPEAIDQVTSGVMAQLLQAGVPINNAGV